MRCQDPIVAGATRRREGAECAHSCPQRGTVGRVRPGRHRGREGRLIPITDLGDALEAFILEHEYCGELAQDGSARPGTRRSGRRGRRSDARVQMLNHRSELKDRPLARLARSPKCRSIGRGTAEPLGSGDRCTPLPSYSSRQVPRIRHTFLRWRDRRRPSCNHRLAESRSRACPGCARVTTLRT